MAKLFCLVFLSLILAGCAGGTSFVVSDSVNTAGPSAIQAQPPVKVEGGTITTGPGRADSADGVAEGTVQRAPNRKTVAQKNRDQNEAGEATDVWQETGAISLLIRRDDGEEEELSALLTEEYLGRFDIPVVFNDAVQYFVRYFTTEKRKIFVKWLKRSRRYVPMIKEILRDQGLPEDLIYLAMIESGFNPKAYSSMKACGPWQFIYETGGRYGLRVNHWVDERRDPEKSTLAAALYLKDLFNQFGNWYLAAAGFNAGEKRIERAVEKHETSDFWELSKYNTLPKETREYIPRLLAAAIIAKDPERFGFTNINYDQPIESITVRVPASTPIELVAKVASTDVLAVRALNPELLTGITPPDVDDYAIRLPESINEEKFREDLTAAALEREEKVEQIAAYTFKRHDSINSVMKKYGVTYNDLMLVNSCDQTLAARQGAVIYIPRFHGRPETPEAEPTETARVKEVPRVKEEPRVEEVAKVKEEPRPERVAQNRPPEGRLSRIRVAARPVAKAHNDYHIVRRGESLANISEKYGIDLATLKQINRLKKGQIYPNMRIELASQRRKIEKPLRTSSLSHGTRRGEARMEIAAKDNKRPQAVKVARLVRKKGKVPSGTRPRVRSARATPLARG